MIEAIIGIAVAIVELIASAVSSLIEAIATLFTVTGETLSAGEAIVGLFSLIAELFWWVVLILIELVVALFSFRKPKKVKKPHFKKSKEEL